MFDPTKGTLQSRLNGKMAKLGSPCQPGSCEMGLSTVDEPSESIPDSMRFSLEFVDEDHDEEYCTAEERYIDTVCYDFTRRNKLLLLGYNRGGTANECSCHWKH